MGSEDWIEEADKVKQVDPLNNNHLLEACLFQACYDMGCICFDANEIEASYIRHIAFATSASACINLVHNVSPAE